MYDVLLGVQYMGICLLAFQIIFVLWKKPSKIQRDMLVLQICLLINFVAYTFEMQAESLREAKIAIKFAYLGKPYIVICMMFLIADYCRVKVPKIASVLMLASQISITILVYTNDIHHLFYKNEFFTTEGLFPHVIKDRGPAYELYTIFLIGCSAGSIGLCLYQLRQNRSHKEKMQLILFIAMVSISFLFFGLFFTGWFRGYDCTLLGYLFSTMAFTFSFLRLDLFDVITLAQEQVVDYLNGGLVVYDTANRLIYNNQLAEEIGIIDKVEEFGESGEPYIYNDIVYIAQKMEIERDGAVYGHMYFIADTTERFLYEKKLEEERQRADDANRAKSMFLSNMSHEIRTPMNSIIGMTQILLRTEDTPQTINYLHNIKNSGESLVAIINDILDFSKIEAGKMDIICGDYEPLKMISDLGMMMWNRIEEKDIELLFDIDSKLPKKLYGDSLRIRQVIINLMNNATKFTESGWVKLSIKVIESDDENVTLRFSVSDSGQGIKEEDKQRLFNAFEQVDEAKNHQKEGTGLGLSICKRLVNLMGGNIGVESEYGHGSEFYFTLPQKIIDADMAGKIKDDVEKGIICVDIKNEYTKQSVIDTIGDYGIEYTQDGNNDNVAYYITDICNDEVAQSYLDRGVGVYILQNPMKQEVVTGGAQMVHKPFYSESLCRMLNGEELIVTTYKEDYLDFVASKAKVLLVDDNDMNLLVATELLEPLKLNITTATNGKKAIELLESKEFDLVLMDHMMPIMDGVEATKIIRAKDDEYFKKIPIIALSANAMAEAKDEFMEAGMNDFVSKPIMMKEITETIKKYLPKELIEYVDPSQFKTNSEKNSNSENTDKNTELPLKDMKLEGIDLEAALKNSGSEKLLRQLFANFYRLIDMKADKLKQCLNDGLIRDYTIEVHALKTTARTIGALELSEEFLELETLGNKVDVETILEKHPKVIEHLCSYKPVLEPFDKALVQNKEEVSVEELKNHFELLKYAMETFDADTLSEQMKIIEKLKVPDDCYDDVAKLRVYVADFAMEDIIKCADEIIGKL